MDWSPLYRQRVDGTIVITLNGVPYHVTHEASAGAPSLDEALTAASALPDLPPESSPETPPGPRIVYKADIWRRATDREALAMDAMLNSQTVRLRRMWADAVHLQSDDELFATIEAALIDEFGADRAGELLT